MLLPDHLSDVINSNGGYTLVGIPGHLYHESLEDTLKKVTDYYSDYYY